MCACACECVCVHVSAYVNMHVGKNRGDKLADN